MTAAPDLGRGVLLTPSGEVVGYWPSNTPDWYAARRCGIGSSDIPAIVGASKFKTRLHVWLDKRGELPEDDLSEAGEWGNLLEDIVAGEWARRAGLVAYRVPTLRNVDHPWMLANLDRGVAGCPEAGGQDCAVEVKTRNAYVAGSWREDVPDDVLAQTQWQLMVTGLPHIHVAALIGGQRLVHHLIEPDPAVQAYVLEEAQSLWDCVQNGVPPLVDASALLVELLDRLNPNRAGAVEIDADKFDTLRAEYHAALAAEKAGKARKEQAKAELVVLLGGGDHFVVVDPASGDLRTVATYTPDERQGVDRDLLKAKHPNAYEECVTTTRTAPILRFKKRRKDED